MINSTVFGCTSFCPRLLQKNTTTDVDLKLVNYLMATAHWLMRKDCILDIGYRHPRIDSCQHHLPPLVLFICAARVRIATDTEQDRDHHRGFNHGPYACYVADLPVIHGVHVLVRVFLDQKKCQNRARVTPAPHKTQDRRSRE